jgi:hypothetical protein
MAVAGPAVPMDGVDMEDEDPDNPGYVQPS